MRIKHDRTRSCSTSHSGTMAHGSPVISLSSATVDQHTTQYPKLEKTACSNPIDDEVFDIIASSRILYTDGGKEHNSADRQHILLSASSPSCSSPYELPSSSPSSSSQHSYSSSSWSSASSTKSRLSRQSSSIDTITEYVPTHPQDGYKQNNCGQQPDNHEQYTDNHAQISGNHQSARMCDQQDYSNTTGNTNERSGNQHNHLGDKLLHLNSHENHEVALSFRAFDSVAMDSEESDYEVKSGRKKDFMNSNVKQNKGINPNHLQRHHSMTGRTKRTTYVNLPTRRHSSYSYIGPNPPRSQSTNLGNTSAYSEVNTPVHGHLARSYSQGSFASDHSLASPLSRCDQSSSSSNNSLSNQTDLSWSEYSARKGIVRFRTRKSAQERRTQVPYVSPSQLVHKVFHNQYAIAKSPDTRLVDKLMAIFYCWYFGWLTDVYNLLTASGRDRSLMRWAISCILVSGTTVMVAALLIGLVFFTLQFVMSVLEASLWFALMLTSIFIFTLCVIAIVNFDTDPESLVDAT